MNVVVIVCIYIFYLQSLLAKAVFDNFADAPDELSFRKGDIITVLERDVDGIVGWWLCSLHGHQGIAPGNRLKQISGPAPDVPSPSSQQSEELDYDVPRPQWEGEDYDIPRAMSSPDYDIPKGKLDCTSPIEPANNDNVYQEIYDIPLKDAPGVVSPTNILSPLLIKADLNVKEAPIPLEPSKEFSFARTASLEAQEVYDVPGNFPADDRGGAALPHAPAEDVYSEIYDIPTGPAPSSCKGEEAGISAAGPPVAPKHKVDVNHNKSDTLEERAGRDPRHSAGSSDCGKRQSTCSVDSGKLSSEDDDYVDYQEIYGFGRDQPVNVYDVPVQVCQ